MFKIVLVGALLVLSSCDFKPVIELTFFEPELPDPPKTQVPEPSDSESDDDSGPDDFPAPESEPENIYKDDEHFEEPSPKEDAIPPSPKDEPQGPGDASPTSKDEASENEPKVEDLENILKAQLEQPPVDSASAAEKTPVAIPQTYGEYFYSFLPGTSWLPSMPEWVRIPSSNAFTDYAATIPKEILAFADDEQQTDDFKKYFLENLQAPLVQLGMRESFKDRVLTPILFPRSTALYWSIRAGGASYDQLAKKGFVADDYRASITTEIACLGTQVYQASLFPIPSQDELLNEWNKAELKNGRGLAQETMGAAKSLDEGLTTAQSFLFFRQKFNDLKDKLTKKITFSMNDDEARKEAELWLTAFGKTISSAMIADQKEHGDALAPFLALSANLIDSYLRESLIKAVLIPAIKQVNSKINEVYNKKMVVDASLSFAQDLIKAPILDVVQVNHPELMAYLKANFGEAGQMAKDIYAELPSTETLDEAEKLRNLLMWKTIQVRVFEYISSFIYLTDAVYVKNTDGYDIRFDRILKAHVTKKLRTEPSAMDIALNNLKTLMGGKDELFFSGLAAIEFVRNGSVLAKKYPVLNEPINILYEKIYGLKVAGQEWWALPPGEMGILMNYALNAAFKKASFADSSDSEVKVNFIAEAAKNSRMTQIQFKNMAMAAGVGAAKVGLSAYVSSPISTFFVALVEAGKLAGASQSGKAGGAVLSFGLQNANADKKVSDGTKKCLTFLRTFIETVNSGFDNVPKDFYLTEVNDT